MNSIKEMQVALERCVTDWEEDGCQPPNFVRKTGMGTEVSKVDVWCGGYQDCHNPVMVGWKVLVGNKGESGILMTSDFEDTEAAVTEAKRLANEALKELGLDR